MSNETKTTWKVAKYLPKTPWSPKSPSSNNGKAKTKRSVTVPTAQPDTAEVFTYTPQQPKAAVPKSTIAPHSEQHQRTLSSGSRAQISITSSEIDPIVPEPSFAPYIDETELFRTGSSRVPVNSNDQITPKPATNETIQHDKSQLETQKFPSKNRIREAFKLSTGDDDDDDDDDEYPYKTSPWTQSKVSARTYSYAFKIKIFQLLHLSRRWSVDVPERIVIDHRNRKHNKVTKAKPVNARSTTANSNEFNKGCSIFGHTMAFLTLGFFNIGYIVWLVYSIRVSTDPHTWRGASNGMLSFLLSAALCCEVPMIVNAVFMPYWVKILCRKKKKGNGTFCVTFFFLVLFPSWALIAALVAPRHVIRTEWPQQCLGGTWDYRIVLDGRIDVANLTKGRITMTDLRPSQNMAQLVYQTTDFVNATTLRNADPVTIKYVESDSNFSPAPLVDRVDLVFPYWHTVSEIRNWASAPDLGRDGYGNYTAYLNATAGPQNHSSYFGTFPYYAKNSRGSGAQVNHGLRLDEMGLLPDVARDWRAVTGSDPTNPNANCQWQPDAFLFEHTDPTARIQAPLPYNQNPHPVIKTGMTRYGGCYQTVVCANNRRQELHGSEWADGPYGMELLNEMLVVPLSILLIEVIKYGSCCGDKWTEYASPEDYDD